MTILSDTQLYPGVHMRTSGDTDMPPNSAELQQVILWDIGPSKPVAPKRPDLPKGKEGDPEYDLAKVEFQEALEDYTEALKTWKRQKTEYADWHKQNGGPVEITMWSCDAHDALGRDAAAAPIVIKNGEEKKQLRYFISARTRGHSNLPNRGLPNGMRPGHGQGELERRMIEGDADMVAARRADPVFGKQEIRQ
jgi:hypothetical protein